VNSLGTALRRRVLALLVGTVLGFAGALAVPGPASADQVELSGSCAWDPAAGQWAVSWTLTSLAPAEVGAYRVLAATATPDDGGALTGIVATDSGFPHDAHQPLSGTQRVPEDAPSASLAVRLEWDSGATAEAQGSLDLPEACTTPEPQVELREWSLDCDALVITIANPGSADATLRLLPSVGDPVEVGVAGGESATVTFPPAAGLAVDIAHQGRSIVDPDDPIEITPAAMAELTCQAGGEGGDLPATGRPVALIIAGAVALVALGVGLFLVARRRRITFTA
jgi:LPXTG-motif cell wall-anchored protein